MSSGLALGVEGAHGGGWKRYPAYRDSGVEWLGSCPSHWCTARIRDHVNLVNGYPFDSNLFDIGEGIPLVRIRDILNDQTGIVWTGEAVSEAAINNGDILIGMDGDFNVSWWNGGYAMLNQRVCCIRGKTNNLDQRFIFYLLHFPLKIINDLAYSTTVKHLSSFDVLKTRFARPSIEEQRAIATFLDRETGRIDALIAKKERQIELLQEKRAALISHAVTKGLDPDAPMKDSGVEWLGEIPEHWNVTKLNHLSHKIGDGIHATPIYVDESNYRFINGNNLVNGSISITNSTMCVSKEEYETHKVDLDKNTILLSINGTIGNVAFYNNELVILGKSAAYIVCIKELSRRFLFYWLLSEMMHIFYALEVTGTTIYNLSLDSVRTMPIILPSFPEQHAIAAFLESETGHIDTLTTKIQESISKLHEYRTALISAAVTGKIDVRGELVP